MATKCKFRKPNDVDMHCEHLCQSRSCDICMRRFPENDKIFVRELTAQISEMLWPCLRLTKEPVFQPVFGVCGLDTIVGSGRGREEWGGWHRYMKFVMSELSWY
jgi:hypothetical protein